MKHLVLVTRTPAARAQVTTSEKIQLLISILSALGTILPFFENKEPTA